MRETDFGAPLFAPGDFFWRKSVLGLCGSIRRGGEGLEIYKMGGEGEGNRYRIGEKVDGVQQRMENRERRGEEIVPDQCARQGPGLSICVSVGGEGRLIRAALGSTPFAPAGPRKSGAEHETEREVGSFL